jgi:DNA-binding transcriptional regulator GbsR (MarR family)
MVSPEKIAEIEREVAETVGEFVQFWGFKRPMGRVWAVLYLSEGPLAVAHLADRLTMSSAAVGQALTELVRLGAVKKSWRAGERRDFFEAEPSVYKLIARILRERELAWLRETGTRLDRALESMSSSGVASDFEHERLAHLRDVAGAAERMLAMLITPQQVENILAKRSAGGHESHSGVAR